MNKKPFLISALCAGILFGCSNQETEPVKETATTTDAEAKEIAKEVNKKIRFDGTIKDKDGRKYEVSIKPIKEEKNVEKEGLAGVAKGDTVYTGDYNIVLSLNGKETQKITLKNLTINATNPLTKIVEGKRDFLLITQTESTNVNWGYAFVIKDGKLIQVKNASDKSNSFIYAETAFKEIQPFYYQTALYDNMEGKWTFTMFKYDDATATLSPSNVESYDFEEGVKYFNTYFKN